MPFDPSLTLPSPPRRRRGKQDRRGRGTLKCMEAPGAVDGCTVVCRPADEFAFVVPFDGVHPEEHRGAQDRRLRTRALRPRMAQGSRL